MRSYPDIKVTKISDDSQNITPSDHRHTFIEEAQTVQTKTKKLYGMAR
ncbi:hypothetical protein DYBT9275_05753 [Dyadobacter sp. CECT 9275]|uniref:Uncharacterized protein n=1 Tax=Dyadobacter helix TaxID=2822344 RepID=A0A916JIX9_9BACT|nr:hypothetical protein DYBT9275_05753 [Dyadobacter sp. CECT 9275]